jgi:CubicO group peptidase (beta-lactamase class C family)
MIKTSETDENWLPSASSLVTNYLVWSALIALVVGFASASLATSERVPEMPQTAPAAQGVSAERLKRLDDLAKRYVDEGRVSGMVNVVLRNGQVIYAKAAGHRSMERKAPLQISDLFRIYSMTKPVTAVAAMQLYEQGKFHLDDPVAKFLPELADLKVLNEHGRLVPLERPITMHDLLTHTAGFSYGFVPHVDAIDAQYVEADLWASKDLDEFAQRVGELPLRFQPGSQFFYSIAVDLTGLVVQRISGMLFDEYLARNIFAPLGMRDTFFQVPQSKRERFLPNYYFDPGTGKPVDVELAPPAVAPRKNVAMQDFSKVGLYSEGGGLVSTAADYARFAEALRNGGEYLGVRILGPKTIAFMAANHLPAGVSMPVFGEEPGAEPNDTGLGFGLGFGVITNPVAGHVIGSAGEFNWGGAAGTVFWIDPVEELVVVSMIQLMRSPWPLRSDLKVAIYQALDDVYE